jgi:hypothetical protein
MMLEKKRNGNGNKQKQSKYQPGNHKGRKE